MYIFVHAYSRFDLEQNQAQAEVQREKSQREKLAREKDLMTGEMFNLRQQLQVSYLNTTYFRCTLISSLRDHMSGPPLSLSDITGLVQMCVLKNLFHPVGQGH